MSSGDHARATRVLDDALAISEAGGYDDIGVLVYAQRGAMLIREGQLKDALAQLDHAVDFLEYAPPVDRAKVLLNRGELHGLLGDLAQAKDDCALALRAGAGVGTGRTGRSTPRTISAGTSSWPATFLGPWS